MLHLQSKPPHMRNKSEEEQLQEQYNCCLLQINAYWRQRSRLRWTVEGDLNTSFFHATVASRRRRNTIHMLQLDDGTWTIDAVKIRKAFVTHFRNLYCPSEEAPIRWSQARFQNLQQTLPRLPADQAAMLDAIPTAQEIALSLFSLGPDRAPGPDGINARFMQKFWSEFRPVVEHEVRQFFLTATMPSHISKSNMVLIPKIANPTKVSDYRPISICNVIYKIISKILASRIKPIINSLIHQNQAAFTPSRHISDHIILMREILHTFSLSTFRKSAFCLKSDLSKAFDRMDWKFIQHTLSLHGFPPGLTSWVMACIRSAHFTILFQGRGDGFITPKRGIRQGCALSPYVFILCMNVLTTMLHNEQQAGRIQGLRLTRHAPPLTNLMYADDLLLMGCADLNETRAINRILQEFCAMSGQRVSPEKSKIWFSKHTPIGNVTFALRTFGAKFADQNEKYLGCPVDVSRPASFNPLLDKVQDKLQSWKARFLSPSGKLVLLKAVLEAVLIYHMSTTLIHKSVLQKIQSRCVQFFWGKPGKKSICFAKWDSLTCDKMEGSLGLRDLQTLNESLILKNVWKLISKESKLLPLTLAAKYHPGTNFWQATQSRVCTRLLRAMQQQREIMGANVKWCLGDGQTCPAYGQPWFQAWRDGPRVTRDNRSVRVKALFNNNAGVWNGNALANFGGEQTAQDIEAEHRMTILHEGVRDKLMFTWSSNGEFSVKRAYQMLVQLNPIIRKIHSDDERFLWKKIWKTKDVNPRIRIFFWKLLCNSLPTGAALARRLQGFDATCHVCYNNIEDVSHVLFHCPHARATWFISSLALRTSFLPHQCLEMNLRSIWQDLEPPQIATFMTIAWHIWKARCTEIFGKSKSQPEKTVRMINSEIRQRIMAAPVTNSYSDHLMQARPLQLVDPHICWTDGSFKVQGEGGAAYILESQGVLLQYELQHTPCASSAFHSEVLALLIAMIAAQDNQLENCTFLSDCEQLVISLHPTRRSQALQAIEWRAYTALARISQIMIVQPGYSCHFIPREDNVQAHHLANRARIDQFSYVGYTYPLF